MSAAAGATLGSASFAQNMAPQADRHAASNPMVKNSDVKRADTPAEGANSFTQGQARTRIAKAGYMHVSALRKDKDGLWQGMARKHGKNVHVALDYKGNVTSN